MQKTIDIYEELKDEAKIYLAEISQHGWDHTERVFNLALHIGKSEGADLMVIGIAAILHDIGRKEELDRKQEGICHAEWGASKAKEILNKYNLPKAQLENVIHCIGAHRARKYLSPQTLEAKCLFDADKIDQLGAVGLARIFHFAGQFGGKIHNSKGINIEETEEFSKEDTAYREWKLQISKLKDKIYTKEGKRIAQERDQYMADFFERFLKEIEGEI